MYTEENFRGRFPLRDILLKVIVVVIFIVLVAWAIAKILGPNNEVTKDTTKYDKVFSENIKIMEDTALTYYNKDNLPKEVGEVSELSLRDMINNSLLDAFTDADNKACDVNASYIRLTKNNEDYTLRVNLKCNEKEDYTLTRVGEYDYCDNTICKEDKSKNKAKEEEKVDDTPKEKVEIKEDNNSNNNNATDNGAISYNYNRSATTNNSTTNNETQPATNNNQTTSTVTYEYKKVSAPVLSNWSSWSDWIVNTKKYTSIMCASTDTNCLREVQTTSRREYIGTYKGQPAYATVYYYSYRTRRLISSGSTDIKWSTYNDTNLLNNGYTYTGNKRG